MSNGGRSGSCFVPRLDCFVSDWAKQVKDLALALVMKLSRKLIKWHVRGVKRVEQRR